MTEQQHRATPEQWAWIKKQKSDSPNACCLLELRDRIEALEAQRETEKVAILEIYEKLDRLKTQHESNWSRIVKLEEANQQPEPIDEEKNDRGFRACLAAIDNATPEQIRAAVAKASANHFPEARKLVPTPVGGLVERVAVTLAYMQGGAALPSQWGEEARAVILAVAEWLEKDAQIGFSLAANFLKQEVERG